MIIFAPDNLIIAIYAETIFLHHGAIPQTVSQILGVVCCVEFSVTMVERVLLHGAHSYSQYPIQD